MKYTGPYPDQAAQLWAIVYESESAESGPAECERMADRAVEKFADRFPYRPVEACQLPPSALPVAEELSDAYLVPGTGYHVPDQLRGAPVLVFEMCLYPRLPTDRELDRFKSNVLKPALVAGSKEGMKQLICEKIDMLWRISGR